MAEDSTPVDIHIKTTSDPKGAQDTMGYLDRMKKSVSSVSAAAEMAGKVSRGLGWVAVIMTAIGYITKLVTWFEKSKTAAQELNIKVAEINKNAYIQAAANEYKKLAIEIAAANARIEEGNALADMRTKSGRDQEDAKSRLDEIREVMGIDLGDPLAAEKKGQISARYAADRAKTAVKRKSEDNETEIQKLQQQRDQLDIGSSADKKQADFYDNLSDGKNYEARLASLMGHRMKERPWYDFWTGDKEDPEAVVAGEKKAADLRKEADDAKMQSVEKNAAAKDKAAKNADLLQQMRVKESARNTIGIEAQAVVSEGSNAQRAAAAQTESKRIAIITEREAKAEEAAKAARENADKKAKQQAEAAKAEREIADKQAELQKARAAQAKIDAAKRHVAADSIPLGADQEAVDRVKQKYVGSHNTLKRDRELAPLLAKLRADQEEVRQATGELANAIGAYGDMAKDVKRLTEDVKKLFQRQSSSRNGVISEG